MRPRLFVPLVGMLAVLALAAPPALGQVFTGAAGGQVAIADWLKVGKKKGTLYLVWAFREAHAEAFDATPSGGATSRAYVGKLPCTVQRGKHFTAISCGGRIKGRNVSLDEFQVDPLLRSAFLKARIGGKTHRVTWTGRGVAPQMSAEAGVAPLEGAWGGAGAYRDAKAGGRVFGQKLTSKGWWNDAFLGEGAGAGAFFEGDAVRVHRRFVLEE